MTGEWRETTLGEFAPFPMAKDCLSESAIRLVMSLSSGQTALLVTTIRPLPLVPQSLLGAKAPLALFTSSRKDAGPLIRLSS